MKKILFAALAFGLGGCGVSEDKLAEQSCDWLTECEWPEGFEFECTEAGDDTDPDAPTCTFVKDAAKECSKALKEAPCEGAAENFPEVCADVYDCEEAAAE